MVPGPQLSRVQLTDEERQTLERWSRRPSTAQGLAQRSQIVPRAASGLTIWSGNGLQKSAVSD